MAPPCPREPLPSRRKGDGRPPEQRHEASLQSTWNVSRFRRPLQPMRLGESRVGETTDERRAAAFDGKARGDGRSRRDSQKTVGAGISPSASLSDQDTVAAATPGRCRAMPALILTVLPVATRGQRPFQTTPISTLAGFAQRAIEGFHRPSWQHRSAVGVRTLSAAPPTPIPPTGKPALVLDRTGLRKSAVPLLPFGWAIGSRLRWV